MRKRLILFAVMLALAIASVAAAAPAVARQKDDVVLTEELLYGDSTAAEGFSLAIEATLDGYLHWETTAALGPELKSDTRFWFTGSRKWGRGGDAEPYLQFFANWGNAHSSSEQGIDMEELGNWDWWTPPIAKLAIDVASRTKAGEVHTETVALADFCEHLPFQVDFQLPAETASAIVGRETGFYYATEGFWPDAGRFLGIPAGDSTIQVTVIKDEHDRVVELETQTDTGFPIELPSSILPADGGLYLVVRTTRENEEGYWEPVVFDTLPEGNGVYYLPLTVHQDEYENDIIQVDSAHIRCVIPLDDGHIPLELAQDRNGDLLLESCVTGEGTYLSVFDGKTLAEKQTIMPYEDAAPEKVWFEDGFVAAAGARVSVLALEDGAYVRRVNARLDESGMENTLSMADVAWNGERLLMASYTENWNECNVRLAVCDGLGLRYAALLHNSQSQDANYSDILIQRIDDAPRILGGTTK